MADFRIWHKTRPNLVACEMLMKKCSTIPIPDFSHLDFYLAQLYLFISSFFLFYDWSSKYMFSATFFAQSNALVYLFLNYKCCSCLKDCKFRPLMLLRKEYYKTLAGKARFFIKPFDASSARNTIRS